MSETKKNPNHTLLHDVAGVALVILGALLGVSAVMFVKQPPLGDPTAYTAVGSALVRGFGPPAILWLCVGFVFVGGRLFVFGAERGSIRDPIGFVATALGLSILMGAFRPESIALGGHWGQFIGGRTSEIATVAGGVALGLASLLIPAWVSWLRVAPPALIAKVTTLVGEDPAPETAAAAGAPRTQRTAPAPKKPAEDPSGVTSAEADALLPDPEREAILEALRSANRQSASSVNHAPSPYPADVRREGGIPAGARPIEPHDPHRFNPAPVERKPAPAAPAVVERSPSGAGAVRDREAAKPAASPVAPATDLAGGKAAGSVGAPARAAQAPELKSALPAPGAPKAIRADLPQTGGASEAARAVPIRSVAGPVGVPSWESEEIQDELEAPEVAAPAEELVVDAYGTPLELVAALRAEPVAARAPAAEQDDEDLDELETELVASSAEPYSGPAEEDEVDALLAIDDDAEVDEDEDAIDEDDDEVAVAEAAAEEEEELHATPLAPEISVEKDEREVVLQPIQNSLFDAPPAPVPVAAAKPEAKSAPRERTVVMEPQAAPSPRADDEGAGDDLVFKSGMLFLQHKRVAVSMLQREFSLDFKQATAVLDQLQEQGLIGPYLGGQRRDILLTAEEWRARVGAAS